MIQIRKAEERGHANHGWLDSRHSFSFADYYDPEHMGWGTLRVINEDRVEPGMGFGTHGHRDMEIVSYVLEGALEHKDSMGNGATIRPHEVQRMSAGKGVLHSEFNPSRQDPVHFLQMWIRPNATGIRPSYEQKLFAPDEKRGQLRLVASNDGREGSVTLHQDADIYATLLAPAESVSHPLREGRVAYVHVARGRASLNGLALSAGDGAKVAGERGLDIVAEDSAELLVFDMHAGHQEAYP